MDSGILAASGLARLDFAAESAEAELPANVLALSFRKFSFVKVEEPGGLPGAPAPGGA